MPSSNESMRLQVSTVENALTRSDGVNALNENLFVTLDYYFFASADEQEQLKLLKSETGLTDKSEHTYNGKFSDEELAAVFGDNSETDGAKCYVYVVANLTVDKLDADAQAAIADKSITLGQLKRKEFQTTDISKNEAQDSFVMYGGDNVTLSITTEGTKTKKSLYGQIKVKRDASKVLLTVTNLKDTVHVADANLPGGFQIWKSDPAHMYVMFYNGVNKSTIHSQINQGYHYVPSGNADDCYFTLDNTDSTSDNPWRNLVAANSSEPNKNLKHEIPFYTYLSDWSSDHGNKERASYMILMVPWQQVDANGDPVGTLGFQNTYYQIETTPTNEYAYYENTFYQILINVGVLGSFVKPEPVEVTAQYMVVPWGEIDVPGTLREGRYLILETNAYTVNNQPSASIPYISSHEITQAYVTKVEWLALKTFASQNRTNTTDTDGSLTVNTYVNNERFDVTYADNKLTLSHAISPDQYTRYNVTVRIVNEAGLSEEAVFTIYPAIYVSNNDGKGGNSFINGYFGHVSPTPPSSGSWQSNGGNPVSYRVRSNTGNNPTHIWAGGAYNYNGNNTEANTYGSLITGDPGLSGTTFTRITITSFTENDEKFSIRDEALNKIEDYKYKITDPRVASGWSSNDLHPFVVTAASSYNAAYTTQQWTGNYDAGKIMVGTDERDKLAPEILVTSVWGRCNPNSITFEQAQKRCATYQEAGYPAGRWRLPTVAEISYIYTLQQRGVINDLFAPTHTGGYWSSAGYPMRYQNGYPSLRTNYSGDDPVRCVYDLWYWGDEQMSENEYHAMPTK